MNWKSVLEKAESSGTWEAVSKDQAVEAVEQMEDEIERLRAALSDADMALAKIDSGFPDYRKIASNYFRRREAAESGGREQSEETP